GSQTRSQPTGRSRPRDDLEDPAAGHDVELPVRVLAEGGDAGDVEAVDRGGELAGAVAEVRLDSAVDDKAPHGVAAVVRQEVVPLELREGAPAVHVAADDGAQESRRGRRRSVAVVVDR